MKRYDLVVIGSGVGLTIISEALGRGLECALVENDRMGGTCLNRGCIPSKVLVYPADVIREAQHAEKVGIKIEVAKIDWDLITERMWSQIDENKDIEEGLEEPTDLTVYRGIGEFVKYNQMKVKLNDGSGYSKSFEGEKFVIASGARSSVPPIKGLKEAGYIATETFFGEKFPKKPWKSLVILGGGVIASEFAHIFSSFGTEITIIEMLPRLVATEEPEISSFLEENFRKHMNMNVLVGKRAIEARVDGDDGLKVVEFEDMKTGEHSDVAAEEILVATGRRSNADLLKVEKTGVEVDERGWIKTNEFLETSKKGIWCIGDANGLYQFRHKANYEAEVCLRNMFSEDSERITVDYSSVPWAIYTSPQIGHVGMTEAEAIEKGHQIFVGIKRYSSVAKGFAMGFDVGDDNDGFVKLIVDRSRKILGAHVAGPHAAILVQSFVYLMNAGFTCNIVETPGERPTPVISGSCPDAGSIVPVYRSMVIHPSLNEVAGWAIGSLRPVNIEHGHTHTHK